MAAAAEPELDRRVTATYPDPCDVVARMVSRSRPDSINGKSWREIEREAGLFARANVALVHQNMRRMENELAVLMRDMDMNEDAKRDANYIRDTIAQFLALELPPDTRSCAMIYAEWSVTSWFRSDGNGYQLFVFLFSAYVSVFYPSQFEQFMDGRDTIDRLSMGRQVGIPTRMTVSAVVQYAVDKPDYPVARVVNLFARGLIPNRLVEDLPPEVMRVIQYGLDRIPSADLVREVASMSAQQPNCDGQLAQAELERRAEAQQLRLAGLGEGNGALLADLEDIVAEFSLGSRDAWNNSREPGGAFTAGKKKRKMEQGASASAAAGSDGRREPVIPPLDPRIDAVYPDPHKIVAQLVYEATPASTQDKTWKEVRVEAARFAQITFNDLYQRYIVATDAKYTHSHDESSQLQTENTLRTFMQTGIDFSMLYAHDPLRVRFFMTYVAVHYPLMFSEYMDGDGLVTRRRVEVEQPIEGATVAQIDAHMDGANERLQNHVPSRLLLSAVISTEVNFINGYFAAMTELGAGFWVTDERARAHPAQWVHVLSHFTDRQLEEIVSTNADRPTVQFLPAEIRRRQAAVLRRAGFGHGQQLRAAPESRVALPNDVANLIAEMVIGDRDGLREGRSLNPILNPRTYTAGKKRGRGEGDDPFQRDREKLQMQIASHYALADEKAAARDAIIPPAQVNSSLRGEPHPRWEEYMQLNNEVRLARKRASELEFELINLNAFDPAVPHMTEEEVDEELFGRPSPAVAAAAGSASEMAPQASSAPFSLVQEIMSNGDEELARRWTQTFQAHAMDLFQDGVVVVPVLTDTQRAAFRVQFQQSLDSMPEFTHQSPKYVMGGFGTLGNPSSFHCPLARTIRLTRMSTAILLFDAYDNACRLFGKMADPVDVRRFVDPATGRMDPSQLDALAAEQREQSKQSSRHPGRYLQQLFDRMMHRPVGASATGESFHRDESLHKHRRDQVFGGWVNLSNATQLFSCVKGTQWDPRVEGSNGFAKITKEAVDAMGYEEQKTTVEVPPGCWICFDQHLVHEVVSKVQKNEPQWRLFTGFRLCETAEPLFDDTRHVIRQQGVPRLPSGQVPPMYADNHWMFPKNREQLVEWSSIAVQEVCLENRVMKKDGSVFRVVKRELPSLQEMGMPLYAPYRQEEIEIMEPRRQWTIEGRRVGIRDNRLAQMVAASSRAAASRIASTAHASASSASSSAANVARRAWE